MGIGLIVMVQYIILDKWLENQQLGALEDSRNSYNLGVIDTMSSIYQQTEDCSIATIILGNFTKDIIDLKCLELLNSP